MLILQKRNKQKKEKQSFVSRIFIMILLIIIVIVGGELYISKYCLTTTHYTITSDRIEHPFRVVQLTDLHASVFGKGNEKLIAAVKKEEPDLVLITGDLINSKSGEDTTIATDLISKLSGIAPVYFSYGNQEKSLEDDYHTDITSLYSQAGAVVLERDYQEIMVKGQKIRIGGIYGYCLPDIYAQENHWEDESAYLKEFQNTDLYTILMCHMPLSWIEYSSLYDWNIDCVFAGHVHGGQVRIPLVGGLWAPDQGWFPGKECGIYSTDEQGWNRYKKDILDWIENSENMDTAYYKECLLQAEYKPSHTILSRGLGNTDKLPRFNNIPEIVVVDYMTIREE